MILKGSLLLAGLVPLVQATANAGASAAAGGDSGLVRVTVLTEGFAGAAAEASATGDTAFASAYAYASSSSPGDTVEGIASISTLFNVSKRVGKSNSPNAAFVLNEPGYCAFALGDEDGFVAGVDSPDSCSLRVVVNNDTAKWTCTCKDMDLNPARRYPYKEDFPGCAFVYGDEASIFAQVGNDAVNTDFDQLMIRKNGMGTLSCKDKNFTEPIDPIEILDPGFFP